MADIVKYDSLGFDEIRRDIETYLTLSGEIDPSDFNASSVVRRITDSLAGLYNQLRIKIDNVRKESIMDSAIRPESIRYLAMSQLSYNPKRKVAPQHPIGRYMWFKSPEGSALNPRSILGNIEIEGESYPISMLESYLPDEENGIYVGRLCIGEWKQKEFDLNTLSNHLSPFHNFRLEGNRDEIDDSGTVHIDVHYAPEDNDGIRSEFYSPATIVNELQNVSLFSEEERKKVVLVKNSYFGGIDINFGDGVIFGNMLYDGAPFKFVVHYIDTPGFIPNLTFIPDNISWDSSFIDEEVDLREFDLHGLELPPYPQYEKGPYFDIEFSNGIDEESTQQIKTLSPYVAMANQRIMTNDDFISRVQRIPNIKSAFSRVVHIEPPADHCQGGDSVSNLVPTATFELSGLSLRGVFPWNNKENYVQDAVVVHKVDGEDEYKRYQLINLERYNSFAVGRNQDEQALFDQRRQPGVDSAIWKEVSVDEVPDYQPLTQIEWDLNYHQQYNFDNLLGFMRVRVKPPVKFSTVVSGEVWDGDFDMTVQLAPYVKGALTPSEINEEVRKIILSYCWSFGVFLDVGELVKRINDINGVVKTYLRSPIHNAQLSYNQYIKPTIRITYKTETNTSERFGKPGLNR